MKPIRRVWYWICVFFAYWYIRCRIYKFWSWAYRRIYERKYDGTPIAVYPDLQALSEFIDGCKWKKDSWRELFDVNVHGAMLWNAVLAVVFAACRRAIARAFEGVTDAERKQVLVGNAARLYNLK